MKIQFEQSFPNQIEILPRLTIMYGNGDRVVAFEWLWFSWWVDIARANRTIQP